MKVAVVIGHRASQPGEYSEYLEQYEYQFNTELSIYLTARLSDDFEVVVYFKDGLSTIKTYEEIQKWEPNLALELHFNGFADKAAFGTEVLAMQGWGFYAKLMQNALAAALVRGVKGDRGYKLLKAGDRAFENVSQLDCPTLLLEPFFGTNPDDCKLFLAKRDEYVEAVHAAVTAILRNPIPDVLRPV